jgi:ribosomal protein S18 acetylase RimI-like enzyme
MVGPAGGRVRFRDVTSRVDDPDVRRVLAVLAWSDEAGHLERIAGQYRQGRARQLLAYEATEDWPEVGVASGQAVACVGIEDLGNRAAEIHSLAVLPATQGRGLARALVLEACDRLGLHSIRAETDRDAVDFYRRLGFIVTSLGDRYPGTERFVCTLDLGRQR